jgi:hypothetical protein
VAWLSSPGKRLRFCDRPPRLLYQGSAELPTLMGECRPHAAGGGLSALTRVLLWFRFPPSMNREAVAMPWRRSFRDRQRHRAPGKLLVRVRELRSPLTGLRPRQAASVYSSYICSSSVSPSGSRLRISASDSQTPVGILIFLTHRMLKSLQAHRAKDAGRACSRGSYTDRPTTRRESGTHSQK